MSRGAWTALSVLLDALAVNAGLILAFVVRFGWPPPEFNFAAYERTFLLVTLAQLLIFFLVDLYEPTAERSGPALMATVAKGLLLGVLALAAASFFLRAFSYPRTVIALGFLTQLLLVYGWRRIAAELLSVRWPERRVLVVGSAEDSVAVAERILRLRRWGYRLVGVITEEASAGRDQEGVPFLELTTDLGDLTRHIERLRPDQLVLATPSRHRHILEEMTLSGFRGEILVVPQLYEVHLGEVNFSLLEDMPLLRLTGAPRPAWRDGFKAVSERMVAGLLVVVTAPLLLGLGLLVWAFSGRPVLYEQERLGKDQKPFLLYKFRTMVPGAEGEEPQLAETGDPRVTAIGRWLRKSRMDELPQLVNVLRGEMSFVGPRPERPEFVREFLVRDPLYGERFQVRPGITGLAQVSGSYATTAAIKLRFDLMYIHHQSLGLDLRILARTVRVVLTGRGAV
ncbi:MAG: sugar transferase [Thermoleophilia bacterium]